MVNARQSVLLGISGRPVARSYFWGITQGGSGAVPGINFLFRADRLREEATLNLNAMNRALASNPGA